jgi:phosphoglucosamine mutase
LREGLKLFPQIMINVRINQKVNLSDYPVIAEASAAIEKKLAGRGRVLLRPSGTEPVVRVMVEGEDRELVTALCQELAEVVKQTLG